MGAGEPAEALILAISEDSARQEIRSFSSVSNAEKSAEAVQLRGYGCRFVAAAQRHALPLLQYLTEPFRECLGRFTYDLPGEEEIHGNDTEKNRILEKIYRR